MPHFEKVSYRKPSVNFAMDIIDEEDHKETSEWDEMDMGVQHTPLIYFNVPLKNPEADKLINFIFGKASSNKYKSCSITRVQRIQNPYLMASFLLTKDAYIENLGENRVKSRWVLHGTTADAIDKICYHNFDLNNAVRHRYGKGIYFTTDIAFAGKFCDKGVTKQLIVANILEGITCPGHQNMQYPNGDTSINKTDNGYNVVVKYDDNAFYPAYVVTFNIVYKK